MSKELEQPDIPVLTADEVMEQDIRKQSDAREIIEKDLTAIGEPVVCVIVRSQSLGKQVVHTPEYNPVTRNGKTVGYARWQETVAIQDFGTPQVGGIRVLRR